MVTGYRDSTSAPIIPAMQVSGLRQGVEIGDRHPHGR